ncbi:MAG: NAD(P)H-hydrate dehydratase [Planctomycetes bacterium]|nr:NAD(P)H-hydrate dehydratase [Planctomycetota bacterium]
MAEIVTSIPQLKPRAVDAHKGLYGKVLVVGGSRGMVGAPSLAGNAALRSGAGLVRIAVPESIQLSVAQITPCATTIPLAEDENGRISREAIRDILGAIEDNDSVALGPGMGQSVELQEVMKEVVSKCQKPMVIDADGLNNLTGLVGGGLQLPENTVLTPHPGEMKRLWRAYFREELPEDRQEQAEKLAERAKAVVVLKGAETVVTDGARTYVNVTGNPGMATGGMGDVLTGIIGALLANQADKLSALNAAILGVYVHGRAGDQAAAVQGEVAMMASDLLDWLGDGWNSLAL